MTVTSTTMPRRWGRIAAAVEHSGLSRSSLYEIARKHRGLFRKHGAATIVDLDMLGEILAELPAADIAADTSEIVTT